MRLKVTIEPENREYRVPLNYQYPLSAIVYKCFHLGSEQIGEWLHNHGFSDGTGKNLKLFNFSNLQFEHYKMMSDHFLCNGSCSFLISSPVETELVETFVQGIFQMQDFSFGNKLYNSRFRISSIELQKKPSFSNSVIFNTLTPITVSTVIEINDKKKIYYYRPSESWFSESIKKNLIKKFNLVYEKEYTDELLIKLHDEDKAKSKLVTVKEGTNEETKIKSFICNIEIQATAEMMNIAYNCGLGEKNSLGFGMVEVLKNKI